MRPDIPLALLFAACATGAQAATVHCIADEAQLRAALAALGGSAPGDHDVRLVERVFFNGTQVFELPQVGTDVRDLRLSGGWDAACGTQTPDPRRTVLDAQGLSAVLSIVRSGTNGGTPLLAVSNLTLRNGRAGNATVGLYLYNSSGSVEVDDVIVHGHRATASQNSGGTAMTLGTSSHDIRLRNALVYDNDGWFVLGDAPLADVLFTSVSLNPDRRFTVVNTTIDGGAEDARALRLESDGHFDLFNNVIRGEVRYAWTITGAGAATAPRVRQAFNHMPVPATGRPVEFDLDADNSTDDPRLDPATLEPLPGSPVVDAGLGNPPGGQSATDAYGRPRVAFTFIDRGALESQVDPDAIFGDGFD